MGLRGWGFARTDGKEGLVQAPPFSPPFDSPRRSAEEAATCADMVEVLAVCGVGGRKRVGGGWGGRESERWPRRCGA